MLKLLQRSNARKLPQEREREREPKRRLGAVPVSDASHAARHDLRTAGPPETSRLRVSLKERFTQRVFPFVARFNSVYPNDILTFPNFLWAFRAVKARAWGVPWEGRVLAVIAPVADLVTYQHASRGGARMSRPVLTAAGTGVHSEGGVAMGLSAARGQGVWGMEAEGWRGDQ